MPSEVTTAHDRTVSVLAYEGMSAFETGIVTEVFGLRWPEIDVPWYELKVCAETPGPIRMLGGAYLETPYDLDILAGASTVIIPSVTDPAAKPSDELISALREAYQRGARIASICTGAFALAGAGLLDGRTATTHWCYAELLRNRYPNVHVDPKPLYVDNGQLLTSAGCAAGLDLCLHLVRSDYGAAIVNTLARRLVIPPHRDGGQAQYIEMPVAATPEDDRIAQSMTWALENLTGTITVQRLAEEAGMSTRTYLRHFVRCVGTTPMRWLISQRIEASLPLLETSSASIEEIAMAVGFDTSVSYRHHFSNAMQVSPSVYRKTFKRRGSEAPMKLVS